MNQPWIYMCSPSRYPLPPPSPSHPSGSSQCTSPEHLSHASNLGWWSICFTLDNIHVSMLFSRNIPPSSWCPPFVICVLSPAPFPWLLYGHFPASQNRVNTWKEMGPFHWKIENYECLSLSPNFLKTEDPWVIYSQIYYYNLWVMVASRYIWNFSFFL